MSIDLIVFISYVVGVIVVYLGLRIYTHLTPKEEWDWAFSFQFMVLWPMYLCLGILGGVGYGLYKADKILAFCLYKIFPR